MKKEHLFIFEGPDGVGKTSAIQKAKSHLIGKGYKVVVVSCPSKDSGTVSSEIRNIVLSGSGIENVLTETLLFLASITATYTDQILPALKSGAVVLCDRFVDTTLVYQKGIKAKSKESPTLSSLGTIIDLTMGGLDFGNVDITTFVLTANVEDILQRLGKRTEESNHYDVKDSTFYETATELYSSLKCVPDHLKVYPTDYVSIFTSDDRRYYESLILHRMEVKLNNA